MKTFNKRIAAAVAAVVVTFSGTAAYFAYGSNIFDPSKYTRNTKLNRNQIEFEDDKTNNDLKDGGDSSDSEKWEQDKNSDDKLSNNNKPDASVIFDTQPQPSQNTSAVVDPNVPSDNTDYPDNGNNENRPNSGNDVVLIPSDNSTSDNNGTATPDITIQRPSTGGGNNSGSNGSPSVLPSNGGNAADTPSQDNAQNGGSSSDNTNSGGSDSGSQNGGSTSDDTNSGNNGGNGNNSSNNGGNNGGNQNGGNNNGGNDNGGNSGDNSGNDNNGGNTEPTVPDEPSKPEYKNDYVEKTPSTPNDLYDGVLPTVPMPDDGITVPDGEETETPEMMVLVMTPSYDADCIYYGEQLDEWKLLCATNVHVSYGGKIYRIASLGSNFKITDYPEVAGDSFTATFSFRINPQSEWISQEVEFVSQPYKLILSDYNHTDYVNPKERQYPSENTGIDLLAYYSKMIGKIKPYNATVGSSVTDIFMGWSENNGGDPIYYDYDLPKKGLNVLYPLGTKKLPDDFKAEVRAFWTKYNNYTYIQTITDYTGSDRDIVLPDGIQTVDMTVDADSLYIPESVFEISDGLTVKNNYIVSPDSTFFTVTDGVLYNKERTALYSVPYMKHTVVLPETVTEVKLNAKNSIKNLIVPTDQIADIDLSKLDGANIYVRDELYISYLKKYASTLGNNKLLPISQKEDSVGYVKDGAVLMDTDDGTVLCGILDDVKGFYTVPDGVTRIAENAFDGCKLDILVLPESLRSIGSGAITADENIGIFFCGETPPSLDSGAIVNAELLTAVHVPVGAEQSYCQVLTGKDDECPFIVGEDFGIGTENGNIYFEESDGATLIRANADIVHFRADTLSVRLKAISNRAFANCKGLTSIELPEDTKYILSGALDGCDSLEQLLVLSTDKIVVTDLDVSKMPKLKFLAFNTENATLNDCVFPRTSEHYYYSVPSAEGFPACFDTFTYKYYQEVYDNGVSYIYGTPGDRDENYIMSVTSDLSGDVTFAKNIIEIAPGAFYNCANEFTIAQESMDNVWFIDDNAFCSSGIAGDLVLSDKIWMIGNDAFIKCKNLTSVYFPASANFTSIPANLFSECYSLKKIEFEEGSAVNIIRQNAFSGTGIEKIVLPSSLQTLAYGVFTDCFDLKTIEFAGEVPPSLMMYASNIKFIFTFANGETNNVNIIVPEGKQQDYLDAWELTYLGCEDLYSMCLDSYFDSLWNGATIEETARQCTDRIAEGNAELRKMLGMEEGSSTYTYDVVYENLKMIEEMFLW